MAAEDEQARKRTPFSAKLPQVALGQAIAIAEALAELAGPASLAVIAQAMGTSLSSSQFRTRIAAAGYYGLIKQDGDRRTLTERGKALTSGDEAHAREARREAVMSTTFGPILHSLRGRQINENTVALRLRGDYDVPESSSINVARALVQSAEEANFVTADSRLDAAAIEEVASVMPKSDENGARPRQAPQRTQTTQRGGTTTETPNTPEPKPKEQEGRPFASGVQVVVNVDASNLTPQQIVDLVRELQGQAQTTT
jgi:hypothetical protein